MCPPQIPLYTARSDVAKAGIRYSPPGAVVPFEKGFGITWHPYGRPSKLVGPKRQEVVEGAFIAGRIVNPYPALALPDGKDVDPESINLGFEEAAAWIAAEVVARLCQLFNKAKRFLFDHFWRIRMGYIAHVEIVISG